MENRVLSSELKQFIGQDVLVEGWLHKKHLKEKNQYILIRDRKGLIKISRIPSKEFLKLHNLFPGTVMSIQGTVTKTHKDELEIHKPVITVNVPVKIASPIQIDQPIKHSKTELERIMKNKVLTIRNINEQNIWRIQTGIVDTIRTYLQSHDFIEFYSPKLFFPSQSSFREIFTLDYYGKKAGLTQTDQFYKQILAGGFERVFEIGPTFRKEKKSSRHLAQFTTIDVEMAFIKDLSDMLTMIDDLLHFVCKQIWTKYNNNLIELHANKIELPKKIPQISLNKLHSLFTEKTNRIVNVESEPTPEEEKFIYEYAKKKWHTDAIFITDYPVSSMKFYDYISEKKPHTVQRADLIFKGIEILTVRRRENRYPILLKQLKKSGGKPKDPFYTFYLQNFKYGMPSHAGFGLGLERLTTVLLGLHDIKEASVFPRDLYHLVP